MNEDYLPEPAYALVRWTYGEVGLSTDELMRPSTYSQARGLSRWPDARRPSGGLRLGYLAGETSIGTKYPAHRVAEYLGLSPTVQVSDLHGLGPVNYVESAPRAKRPTPLAKADGRKAAQDAIRPKLDGGSPVVLSDQEMMNALGIMPIRMGEMD